MKTLRLLVLLFLLYTPCVQLKAQADTSLSAQRALLFADSLLNAFRCNNLNQYIALSYPGIIKYYGGKNSFLEFVQRARMMVGSSTRQAMHEKIAIIQLQRHSLEWQCVVRKTAETLIDGRKAQVVSYMVGQSTDDGLSWTYFDVALNSVEHLIYIMPDIFDTLSIPQRQVIFEKNVVASIE